MEKQADLRKWFKEKWVDISRKNPDGSHPECGRDEAKLSKKGYPKCRPKAKAAQMTKKEKSYAVRAKRSKRQGVGGKPTMVPTEKPDKQTKTAAMDKIAKNVPTDPAKWSQAKAQAKAKFDVYPSAYANGWAAKKYKAMGGGWKKEASLLEKISRVIDVPGRTVSSSTPSTRALTPTTPVNSGAAKSMGQKLMQGGRIAGKKFNRMSTGKKIGVGAGVLGAGMLAKRLLSRPKPQQQTVVVKTADDHSIAMTEENNIAGIITDAFLTKIAAQLDPVGQEDKDIDNDGDHDSSDEYLAKRRKAIGKAMANRKGGKKEMTKEALNFANNDGGSAGFDAFYKTPKAKRLIKQHGRADHPAVDRAAYTYALNYLPPSAGSMKKKAAMETDIKATDAGKGAAMSAIRGKSAEQKKRERRGLALTLGIPAAMVGGSFAYDALKKKAAACGSTDQPEHKRVPGKVTKKKAPMQKEAKEHMRELPQYVADTPKGQKTTAEASMDSTKSMTVDGDQMAALKEKMRKRMAK